MKKQLITFAAVSMLAASAQANAGSAVRATTTGMLKQVKSLQGTANLSNPVTAQFVSAANIAASTKGANKLTQGIGQDLMEAQVKHPLFIKAVKNLNAQLSKLIKRQNRGENVMADIDDILARTAAIAAFDDIQGKIVPDASSKLGVKFATKSDLTKEDQTIILAAATVLSANALSTVSGEAYKNGQALAKAIADNANDTTSALEAILAGANALAKAKGIETTQIAGVVEMMAKVGEGCKVPTREI